MIQWSLMLTANQMEIMEELEPRKFGEPYERVSRVSHWITSCRALEREGLLEYHWNLKPGTQFQDTNKCGHFLTERGRFVLRMIREDMEKFIAGREVKAQPKRKKVGKADAA